MKQLKFVFLAMTLLFSQLLLANESPVQMLDQTANQILDTLKQNKSTLKQNSRVIHQAVRQYLLPIVDVQGMSRSVLGRQAWNKASSADRADFTRAFTQLVIRTYATPLAEYTDESIKFLPQRTAATGQFTRVNSMIIRSKGPNIPLSYSLVSKNGQWKVYDLSVEGVSLLQSFRNQFSQALENESVRELIVKMGQNSQSKSLSKG